MNHTEAQFEEILATARKDPRILAFWLNGSRGKGTITPHSDYDCTMVVKDEALEEYKARYASLGNPEIELGVLTLDQFRRHAAWGSPEAWDRYNFAHLKALVDKAGEVQALIDEKGSVPSGQIPSCVNRALDHYINQVYRSLKCIRDGHLVGARLEAAEEVNPLLDAVFALNGRLRPYFKYLEWELKNHPLQKFGMDPREFIDSLLEILATADVKAQQGLLLRMESLFRSEGYGAVFDGWGEKLPWMKEFSG